MPTLIFEHAGMRRGGLIAARVLIGRLPTNGVVLNDVNVSRLHAWIIRRGAEFFLCDAGTASGTFLNGQRLQQQASLHDGDQIKIGTARMLFRTNNILPSGFTAVDLRGRAPSTNILTAGILFDCPCGAPHWAKPLSVGQPLDCLFCGRTLTIPNKPGALAFAQKANRAVEQENSRSVEPKEPPSPSPARSPVTVLHPVTTMPPISAAPSVTPSPPHPFTPSSPPPPLPAPTKPATTFCSICHSELHESEPSHVCPSCGLRFHEECWLANHGCSAYGCPQVNILAPPSESPQEPDLPPPPVVFDAEADAADQHKIPWDYVLLGLAVLASLAGAFFYGLPAALVAIASLAYQIRQPRHRPLAVARAAFFLAALGCAAGIWFSRYFHSGGKI